MLLSVSKNVLEKNIYLPLRECKAMLSNSFNNLSKVFSLLTFFGTRPPPYQLCTWISCNAWILLYIRDMDIIDHVDVALGPLACHSRGARPLCLS